MTTSKKTFLTVALVGLCAAAIGWYVLRQEITTQMSVAKDESVIQNQVTSFGGALKNVSLLAPAEILKKDIETNYKPYLTPELLESWQSNPSQALGREVSSPWPDHIEIMSLSRQNESLYKVGAEVIEITSTGPSDASKYPVQFLVEKRGDTWLISGVQK